MLFWASLRTSYSASAFRFLVGELVILAFFGAVFAALFVVSRISGRKRTILTEHRFAIAPESLVDETAFAKRDFKWPDVQKLARTRRYIFIYVAQPAAFVIPKRAFQDDDEWNAFYQFCRERTSKT
jgi:hypothetical protein